MKPLAPLRTALAAFASIALMLGTVACQNSPGSAANPDSNHPASSSSGVGPGGHAPATNPAAGVGPKNAGPAGSQ